MHMKWENKGLKTPLARARGLGSARSVVDGWIKLRVTSIASAVLSIWFVCFLAQVIGAPHAEFSALLAQPLNAVAMILLVVFSFYHAILGVREVVEDYVTCEYLKLAKLIGQYLFFFALGVACVFSVLKIAFTGGI